MPRYRGNTTTFTARLVDENGTVLVPEEPRLYPRIAILDPEGTEIWTATPGGMGVKPLGNGEWFAEWFVPKDAALTTEEGPKWVARWMIVTDTGRDQVAEERFDIADSPLLYDETLRDNLWYLAMKGMTERLFLRLDRKPEQVAVRLSDELTRVLLQSCDVDPEIPGDPTKIKERIVELPEQDTTACPANIKEPFASGPMVGQRARYVYWIDTPVMDRIGDYLVTWAVRYSELEPGETVTQVLRVPDDIAWACLPSLQLLVDKIGKPFNSVFGYTDAMLHEGLLRGVDWVNNAFPPTDYSLRQLKGGYGLFDFVLLGAAIRVLTWQGILEIDQAFDFSGQTITLNHSRDYEGIVGRLATELERLEAIKTTVYRRSVPVGSLGIRYPSYRNLSQPEILMTRDGPVNQTFSLLVRLGLI